MTTSALTPEVPIGFEPHARRSPVTDPWRPLYAKNEERSVVLGLAVGEQHCNGRGILHGGVIASLADNAMGLSVHRAALAAGTPIESGALTMNLAVDYLAIATKESWVEIRSDVHSLGRSVGVVDCLVVDDEDHVIARANATFRYRRLERS